MWGDYKRNLPGIVNHTNFWGINSAVFKLVVTVSFMRPEPVGWPFFPG